MNRLKFLLLACLLPCVLACAGNGGNTLDGSIKTVLNIDFERVEIKLFGDALRVQYLKAFQATTEDDVVAEVTVSTTATALTTQTEVEFTANATLERAINTITQGGSLIEDTTEEFPPVFSGFILFNELSTNSGDNISGRFSVTFNSGLVLSGEFSEILEVDDSF